MRAVPQARQHGELLHAGELSLPALRFGQRFPGIGRSPEHPDRQGRLLQAQLGQQLRRQPVVEQIHEAAEALACSRIAAGSEQQFHKLGIHIAAGGVGLQQHLSHHGGTGQPAE